MSAEILETRSLREAELSKDKIVKRAFNRYQTAVNAFAAALAEVTAAKAQFKEVIKPKLPANWRAADMDFSFRIASKDLILERFAYEEHKRRTRKPPIEPLAF